MSPSPLKVKPKSGSRRAVGRKKSKPRKPLGRGGKMILLLMAIMALSVALWWGVQSVKRQMLASRILEVNVDGEFFGPGDGPGQFKEPWGVCAGPNDSLYVSDFGNSRIEKFTQDGQFLQVIGSKGNDKDQKPGTFNQPSGIYVDPDGFLYVCDTFFHRIQKFDSQGKFVKTWSHGFFGPKGIAGDAQGHLYVADTGNHKIQVFDREGNFLSEWGAGGRSDAAGRFEEPNGIVAGPDGFVYVADTENRRIEKFDASGKFKAAFKVEPWLGKCCEVPYLAVGPTGLYATNASANSVLRLDPQTGKLLAIYRKKGELKDGGFSYAAGIALDSQGRVWVVEKSVGKVARFIPPQLSGH